MSTDYHIYCRTCSARHDFDQVRRQNVSTLRHIITFAAEIGALKGLIEATEVRIKFDYGYSSIDASWFAAHAAHQLTVIDEYGRIEETCGKRFRCSACMHSHYCALEQGHQGECRPEGKVSEDGRADALG